MFRNTSGDAVFGIDVNRRSGHTRRRKPHTAAIILPILLVGVLLITGLVPVVSELPLISDVAAVGGGTTPVLTQAVKVNNNSASTRGSPNSALGPDGTLYVVWEDARSGSEHIYFAASSDGGASFGQNKRVDDAPKSGSKQLRPTIAVSSDGDIFVAWQDNRRYVFDFDVYFAYSRDGGKSFSQNIKVDDSPINPISWQERPSIAVDSRGNPVVAWTDDRTGMLKTRLARSTDEGQTFGPSIEVTAGMLSARGQTGIAIRYSGSKLFAAHIDNASGLPHPYLTWSTDDGLSFAQQIRLDNASNARQRSVTLASLPDNGVIVVWEDSRNVDWDIYGAKVSGSGAVISSNFLLNDGERGSDQMNPTIGVDPTGIFVAWEDTRLNKFAIRLTYTLLDTISFATSTEVASPGGDQLQSMPSAAASKNRGGFFVVWEDSTVTTEQVLESRGYVPGQAAPWTWALAPKSALPGTTLTFEAKTYDPDSPLVRCTWDFGDGSAKVVGNPVTHSYPFGAAYTFRVFVDDLSGLAGHNVSVSAPASIGFILTLPKGWTQISLPLVGTNYYASTLGLSSGDIIVNWNSLTQTYDKTFVVGLSPRFADFPVVPGQGYWVLTQAQRTLLIGGINPTAQQNPTINVPAWGGWAMVGLCSFKTTWKASDITTMFTGASVSRVIAWYPATQSYVTYVPGFPINNFSIVPGCSYWVKVTGSGVLSYTP